jgi:CheY-like chemotaxis protein
VRILIAEDDDVQGEVMQQAIASRGYEAEIVTSGLEAVRRLRTGSYHLALIDHQLPDVDGLAAARLLQELPCEGTRPRLIAITATAERLQDKDGGPGAASFDAVVSKRLGVSALLAVIDDHVQVAAALNAAAEQAQRRLEARRAATLRRRRKLAPLAAVPALLMAGAFAVAACSALASLDRVEASAADVSRTMALTADATTMVGAVQSAVTSQRTYLATGLPAHRAAFEADAQRVDRLLAAASLLATDPSVEAASGPSPNALIGSWMNTLGEEARARAAAGGAEVASADAARDITGQLQEWAQSVVRGSQRMVLAGLDAARQNVRFILLVLAAGIVHGLWSAVRAVQRRWREARPALALPRPGSADGLGRPPSPMPRTFAPRLRQDG